MQRKLIFLLVIAFLLVAMPGVWGSEAKASDGVFDVKSFGAKGDGVVDDTAAIQSALDAASAAGGIVYLAPAKYMVKGSLRVPAGVTVQGVSESPQWSDPLKGSIVLATGGRDNENAPALFEMGSSSAVRGIIVYYPDQKPKDIHPYSWTFHLQGMDNTVENVTLINSYNGIRLGPEGNCRHRIRSVYGCVLRRGLSVDSCSDIGRIENVQWHCHWWSAPAVGGDWDPVHKFMVNNLEAFIFGRTDWEYVTNTFVFPVNIGYRFIRTTAGTCNGQFSGIGADEAQTCVLVDEIQPMGLLITNGQFVALRGDNPISVQIQPTCTGSVRLVNCAFWGPSKKNLVSHSQSFVSASDCYFSSAGRKNNPNNALIEADSGKLQVRGCSFATDEQPSILLKKGLKHAIISENNGGAGVDIVNEIGQNAIINSNEAAAR